MWSKHENYVNARCRSTTRRVREGGSVRALRPAQPLSTSTILEALRAVREFWSAERIWIDEAAPYFTGLRAAANSRGATANRRGRSCRFIPKTDVALLWKVVYWQFLAMVVFTLSRIRCARGLTIRECYHLGHVY